MSKYNIDRELAKIAKIKMPDNPALLPLMNILLCQKLRDQGIAAELHEIKGACHGFETAIKSNLLKNCIERRVDWLRLTLNNVDI